MELELEPQLSSFNVVPRNKSYFNLGILASKLIYLDTLEIVSQDQSPMFSYFCFDV